MKLIESILAATDFSLAADQAVQCAARLAHRFGSRIYLTHVIPGARVPDSGASGSLDPQIAARLETLAEGLRLRGLQVQASLAGGDVAEQIAARADQHDINVIVIGAGHPAAGGRYPEHGTAPRVRRRTSRPVWMVKPDAAQEIRRLLCPVDESPAAARALRNAIHLARQLEAELTVLRVVPRLASCGEHSLAWYSDLAGDGGQGQVAGWRRFLARFDFTGLSWRVIARQGGPAQQILLAAREIQADLLVMGSVGHSGLKGWLLGGVARKVAGEMPCSLLTVRAEEPIQLCAPAAVRMDPRACAARCDNSVCSRFVYGQELLQLGFPEQAQAHFRECVAGYELCTSAWFSLAAAQQRLGRRRDAEECRLRAEQIRGKRLEREIQAEVRGQHLLFRPMFGIR